MGLDNIPREYPCAAKATRDSDNRIDCAKTQEENNCPWKNEKESNPMVNNIDKVASMFGTDCWYRGKYGNFLLDILHDKVDQFENYEYTFYGEDDDGLDTDYCFDMAKWMRDNTEKFAFNAKKYTEENQSNGNVKDYIDDWAYAIWWLEFVGKTSNGSAVWW
jgi:hypothetical protein